MKVKTLQPGETQVVVLQPSPYCNINCHYCYLPHRTVRQVMAPAVRARIFEALFSSSLLADTVTLLWHAGEPLVVPLAFYQESFTLIERFNTRDLTIIPVFQTNGMLITQQWCDFINQHSIRVGVSLDGPQHVHDRNRVNRAGKGTFAQTMRGVQLLQENGINPSILAVLTKYSLDYPDEIWHFFQNQHLTNLAFNLEEVNGAHTRSSLESEDDRTCYKHFLRRILELRDQCEKPPLIREIDTFRERIQYLTSPVCSQENIPGAILSFDYQGNVTTFASELLTMDHPLYGDFLLGNVCNEALEDILAGPKLSELDAEVQNGVAKCKQTCAYFDFCGGGSPVNKLSEHGTFDVAETMYCRLKIQTSMDVVLDYQEAFVPHLPSPSSVVNERKK